MSIQDTDLLIQAACNSAVKGGVTAEQLYLILHKRAEYFKMLWNVDVHTSIIQANQQFRLQQKKQEEEAEEQKKTDLIKGKKQGKKPTKAK